MKTSDSILGTMEVAINNTITTIPSLLINNPSYIWCVETNTMSLRMFNS